MLKARNTVKIPKEKGRCFIIPEDPNYAEVKYSASQRPECPECTSGQVISRGLDWQCKNCGKYWVKNPRVRVKIKTPAFCPYCKSENDICSHGTRWICNAPDCNKTWGKHRHAQLVREYEND